MTIKRQWFWFGLFVALLLRFALIPNPGFEADISFWKSWGLATIDKGVVEGIKATNNNYPTPFAYLLGLIVKLYSALADPHAFNQFWLNTNTWFLTVAKLPAIIADFGIAVIILWISTKFQATRTKQAPISNVQNSKRFGTLGFGIWKLFGHWNLELGISSSGPVLALLYLLSPISLIDGAWWGQVDSLGVFIFLIAFLLALRRWPFWAGAVFMLAMMTKLQNMIYGPVFFLFIWQIMGYDGLVRAMGGATLAFFGLNIEFLLTHTMDRVVGSLTQNFDYFPWMSLNAFNLWWIVAGGRGMQMSDKFLAVGIMNAKTVGLVLFSSIYVFALLRQLFNTFKSISDKTADALKLSTPRAFLESLILINASFFLFQTESHDRYAFPLSVFLLLWAPFWIAISDKQQVISPKEQVRKWKLFTFHFSLFTLFYFYNLHTALVINYPTNGIPLLNNLTQPFFTITTSVVLLGLFAVFLVYLVRHTKRIVTVTAVATLFTILFLGNLPLFTKKPVPLTKLTPYVSQQGFGTRQTDMPVNAGLGISKWSFLSVQYAFYRKGIGTHANSFMIFDIGGHFKKFTTDYGIDTEAGDHGSAIFEVYGDDRLLFRSEKMGRFTMPRHTDIDITGVKKLGLVTTDAGDGINDDHTDWLSPTLWP